MKLSHALTTVIWLVAMPLSMLTAQTLFDSPVSYTAGSGPWGIAPADYDNDGDQDLAVGLRYAAMLSIYLNNGDGSLQAPIDYASAFHTSSVASADFDSDGDYDVAVVRGEAYSSGISVFINGGGAAFAAPVDYATGDYPCDVVSADFDGDNNYDLAVTNEYSDNVSILFGNGDGTFQESVNCATGDGPHGLYATDFNNDSHYDLAVVNTYDDDVSVLINKGDGTFEDAADYPVGGTSTYPGSVTCGDFDNDGWMDFAVNRWDYNTGGVCVFLNYGDGTFEPAVTYGALISYSNVVSADFDDDGYVDLVTAAGEGPDGISFFKNNGDGSFAPAVVYSSGGRVADMPPVDLDSDGDLDLAVANTYPNGISILINLTYEPGPCCRYPGDADHDGQVDILDFQFLRDYLHRGGPPPPCFEEADVNGDGNITKEDMSCMARYLFSKGTTCEFVECP
ncbi:MAG: VCBS repeat-containing protein [Candidatus Zixiibacteriota bacterium]|nr:MAG: VCBS repeat-containing protein [candidate division Zixibacteria bacterium]